MNSNSIMYSKDAVEERIRFHERKVIELVLTGTNPNLLAIHRKELQRFKKMRLEALYGDVDITKYF